MIGMLFKVPKPDFDCPRNMGEDGKPKPKVVHTGAKPAFFETPHCTSRAHCFACRGNRQFRESISNSFTVPSVDFDCPFGVTAENIVKPPFFETDICKSRQNCKSCRTEKKFREAIVQRFSVSDVEFKCPLGIIEENFQDGKFPSLVQEAMNLAKSVAKVAVDAAQGKGVAVPEEEKVRRLAICEKCDIYDIERRRCRKCGCQMDMKSMLASLKCEIGKW